MHFVFNQKPGPAQDGLTGFQCLCENPPCGPGGHPQPGESHCCMNPTKPKVVNGIHKELTMFLRMAMFKQGGR